MSHEQKQYEEENRERGRILARYFKVDSLKDDNSHLVRRYLWAAVAAAIVMPLLFYWQFGKVSWFAIGFTVFLVVLCLLVALGLYFQNRTAFHTQVPARNNLADRIGAFWLMACAFGPLLGWVMTATVFPLTAGSWRWQYLARVFFAVVLPVITAVPLVRYARGKAALIAVPLLVGITALPLLSCWWVLGDLHDGATVTNFVISRDLGSGQLICMPVGEQYDLPCDAARAAHLSTAVQVTWLPHTKRVLQVEKL